MNLDEMQNQLRAGTARAIVEYWDHSNNKKEWYCDGVQVDLVWNVVYIPEHYWSSGANTTEWNRYEHCPKMLPLDKCRIDLLVGSRWKHLHKAMDDFAAQERSVSKK